MNESFADLTTMRVGGPASDLHEAHEAAEIVDIVRRATAQGKDVLVLGGGSNLLVGDQGFDGVTVKIRSCAIGIGDDGVVTAAAGTDWDSVVARSLEEGLAGLESLSGIPGSVGGTPVQNVGAYGATTSDVLQSVTVYDRATDQVEVWGVERCGFGRHRDSVFKHSRRWVVLEVRYALRRSDMSAPIAYSALASELGSSGGAGANVHEVRDAVLSLRARRGMLLDETDKDTWSVGSFFLNPVVREVPPGAVHAPSFPDPDGIKLSAAWLIENAGFARGYGADVGRGTVALSSKHTLAITNRGGATAREVAAFATHIRAGVLDRFGLTLTPECDLVNCELG